MDACRVEGAANLIQATVGVGEDRSKTEAIDVVRSKSSLRRRTFTEHAVGQQPIFKRALCTPHHGSSEGPILLRGLPVDLCFLAMGVMGDAQPFGPEAVRDRD